MGEVQEKEITRVACRRVDRYSRWRLRVLSSHVEPFGKELTPMALMKGRRVVGKSKKISGVVMKRVIRNGRPVCFVKLDEGGICAPFEDELTPTSAVWISLGPQRRKRKKRGSSKTSLKTSKLSKTGGGIWFVSGGRPGSKR